MAQTMPLQERVHAPQRVILLGVSLFVLLCGVYWLTYRGFPVSIDEYFIFDSSESLIRRGTLERTYGFREFNRTPLDGSPWGAPLQEPLMAVLTAPFVGLGQSLNDVGTVHVTWIVNILVTAATAVSLYAGALMLRYSLALAWTLGLIYGVGTLAWPYSRHLFREPLMALFVLWAFTFALLIRRSWQEDGRPPGLFVLFLVFSVGGALLAKSASVLMLPSLLLLVAPPLGRAIRLRAGLLRLALAGAALGVLALLIMTAGGVMDRYNLGFWQRQLTALDWGYIWESLLGYHVSFGRSLWLYSPVLVLAGWGAWRLWRERHWREVIAVGVFVLALSASYGIAHGASWWGSWGWGPRYMLPLIPVLMLVWLLPALKQVGSRWQVALVAGLTVTGGIISLLGMSVRLSNYYTDLNRAGILVDFSTQPRFAAYNWDWRWSPLRYHVERLDTANLDYAWWQVQNGAVSIAATLIVIFLVIAWSVWLARAQTVRLPMRAGFLVLPLAGLLMMGLGLAVLRDDPRFTQDFPDVRQLIAEVQPATQPEDAVFVDRHLYLDLVMNWLKTPGLVAVLPYAPGEDFGQGPQLEAGTPRQLAGESAAYALDWTAARYDTLWLIASSGPFEPDKRRPIERYLATIAYPVTEINVPDVANPDAISQRARALRYHAAPMPDGDPELATDYVFDERLALIGCDLPDGDVLHPGDVLPVSLAWMPLDALDVDANISVQLVGPDGLPVVQRDGQPQAGFGRMTAWPVDQIQRDPHGLLLPETLPPGRYTLQVVVYRWQDGIRLTLADGADIARLAQIEVRP